MLNARSIGFQRARRGHQPRGGYRGGRRGGGGHAARGGHGGDGHHGEHRRPPQSIEFTNGDKYMDPCAKGWCNENGHRAHQCLWRAGNLKCTNEECRTPWTHYANHCPHIPSTNAQQQINQVQRHTCDHCGRGHRSENCRNRGMSEVVTSTPTVVASPYCKFCNVTNHITEDCEVETSFIKHQQSKIRCIRCKEKGHSHDICLNPAGKKCTKCLAPGHERQDCSRRLDKGLKTPTTPLRQRFEKAFHADTKERSRFHVGPTHNLHPTQEARLRLERFITEQNLHRGSFTAEEWAEIELTIARVQREIEVAERQIFPHSSKRYADLQSVSSLPSQPSPPSTSSNTPQNGARRDSAWTRRLIANADLRGFKEDEMIISQKIDASRALYTTALYNGVILENHSDIMAKHIITQLRMDEIKRCIAEGGIIWRDPQAVAALFARKVPSCLACGTLGAFADQHFEPIVPETKASKLYNIEDDKHHGWGIFIVFRCERSCSTTASKLPNYKFVDIEFDKYPDIDWENDPEYRRYGRYGDTF